MSNLDLFNEKFKVEELLIYESKCWKWSLRPLQPTLGSGVLSLKRYAESFAEMTAEEGADLADIVKVIEERLKNAFGYEKINYLMLMMVDAHLHFHIIPRYGKEKEFAGVTWVDSGWPGPPDLAAQGKNDEVMEKIKAVLRG